VSGGATSLAGLRVLVVEDEPVLAMFLEETLARRGCRVLGPAAMLAEALALAEAGAFDVALLDVNLRAGAKAIPVAGALAARGKPFVLATGYMPDGLPEPLRDRPTLLKPYGEAELVAALREAAGR
jgi:CheY-like chemotaxis protein